MRDSPRIRRLRTDRNVLEQLKLESTILDFVAYGNPAEMYLIRFFGRGFWRPEGGASVLVRERHEVQIRLGASYPRMTPELSWQTPIFHPNISSSGWVCLGGYGTYWAPSLHLDELCLMLWDMVRYRNYNVESPYNREAAGWVKSQRDFVLPIDPRPIRNKLAGAAGNKSVRAAFELRANKPPITGQPRPLQAAEVVFIEDEILEAQIVEPADSDILFIE